MHTTRPFPMLPRHLLGTAVIPDTDVQLQLYQSGELFSIKIPGRGDLMNSRVHGSEKALAELACGCRARAGSGDVESHAARRGGRRSAR